MWFVVLRIPLTILRKTNPIFKHLKENIHFTFSLFFPLCHRSTEIYDEGKQVKYLVLYFL